MQGKKRKIKGKKERRKKGKKRIMKGKKIGGAGFGRTGSQEGGRN